MIKRRGFWLALAVLFLTAVLALSLWDRRSNDSVSLPAPPAPAALELLPSDVTTARVGELRQLLPVSGSLRAVHQASVKARVGGEVQEVLVREGEAVQTGQVLVRMDTREYQSRVEQAKGALRAAEGQLEIAAKARDNNKALVERGFISKTAFENAQSQYEIALANRNSARAALDLAQKTLGDTVIRSPLSGFVSQRRVQPGEKVAGDAPLLDVIDLRQLEMETAVPAADVVHVRIGQTVQVNVEGLQDTLSGKVARINPATLPGSRSVPVYITIDNQARKLRAGMFATAQLTLARQEQALVVPAASVQMQAGASYVFAIEDGKLVRRQVTLGMKGTGAEGEAVEITSGLSAGAEILTTDLGQLREGTPVRIVQTDKLVSEAARANRK